MNPNGPDRARLSPESQPTEDQLRERFASAAYDPDRVAAFRLRFEQYGVGRVSAAPKRRRRTFVAAAVKVGAVAAAELVESVIFLLLGLVAATSVPFAASIAAAAMVLAGTGDPYLAAGAFIGTLDILQRLRGRTDGLVRGIIGSVLNMLGLGRDVPSAFLGRTDRR